MNRLLPEELKIFYIICEATDQVTKVNKVPPLECTTRAEKEGRSRRKGQEQEKRAGAGEKGRSRMK
jgi:hypothetical protein